MDEKVKKLLFSFAAEIQHESGRKVSLSEAIHHLLETRRKSQMDKEKMHSLFGCLREEGEEARVLLIDLRKGEEKRLEALRKKSHF
ncbi:MAG: hypothetical protein HYU39_04680 [Thaumarchaeota archaeon]|nr:hypothetical protein [Nitrososphaerota archaeon]